MTRPRAADDFPAIRARMEELQRERNQMPATEEPRSAARPRPYSVSMRPSPVNRAVLPPEVVQHLSRR